MSNKITISDIATALDISTISVSRALSGQSGVSKELKDKILCKAKEMGYVKCSNKNDYNILVLHQKPFIQDNSNFPYMVQGIEKALQNINAEYDIEFIDKDKQLNLQLPHKLSKEKTFDGIIFIGRFNSDYVNFLKEKVKNQVFYTGYSPSYDCDSVWYNFNNGGYKQCEYLIKNGHRNIGFIGNSSVLFRNKEKVLGITSALEDYEIPIKQDLFLYVEDDFDNKFEKEVMELLNNTNILEQPDFISNMTNIDLMLGCKNRPSAIICQWDFIALKLIKLFYKMGIRVPEDISIISSGNTDMSSLSYPALTTLDLNIEYACECAVNLLVKRITTPDKPYENIAINSTLIERDSVKNLKWVSENLDINL